MREKSFVSTIETPWTFEDLVSQLDDIEQGLKYAEEIVETVDIRKNLDNLASKVQLLEELLAEAIPKEVDSGNRAPTYEEQKLLSIFYKLAFIRRRMVKLADRFHGV